MAEKDAATDDAQPENTLPTAEDYADYLSGREDEDYTAEDVFDDLENTDASGNPIVRFNGNREDNVSFEIDTGSLYKGPYAPDAFEAERFGLVAGIQDALDRLAEVADLRHVSNSRHGVFYVDEDEGRVSGVKLTFVDQWVPEDVDLDALEQELLDIVNDDEDEGRQYSDDELDAVNVHSAGGYYGRPRYVVSYVQDDGRGGRGRKTFETEERAQLVASALVYHGRAEEGTVEVRYEEDYGRTDDEPEDDDEPEVRTDGGLTDAEESLRHAAEQDEEPPLDADDLSEGDVVELELSDGRIARYRVQGEWDEDDVADLESYRHPSEEAEGKFPGLQAERVWSLHYDRENRLPRDRATLVLDADSYTGGLVDNFPDDSREGYSVHSVRQAEVVEVPDRWEVEGELPSPHASHVRRVVREAFEDDPLVGTIEPENITLQDADHSGTGCLGDDLGVTVHVAASMDLHVREAFEEFLNENLNEGVWFECEQTGTWTFLRDTDSGTVRLR